MFTYRASPRYVQNVNLTNHDGNVTNVTNVYNNVNVHNVLTCTKPCRPVNGGFRMKRL